MANNGISSALAREIRNLSSLDQCRTAFDLVRQQFRTIQTVKSAKAMTKLAVGMAVKVEHRGETIRTKIEKINLSTVTVKINGQMWRVHASSVKPA